MAAAQLIQDLMQQPSARHFLRLPTVDEDPEYYEEVKTPISLEVIAGKASRGEYPNPSAVLADFNLMLTNTRDLDGADSDTQRVKDSYELEKAFAKMLSSLPLPPSSEQPISAVTATESDESRKRKAVAAQGNPDSSKPATESANSGGNATDEQKQVKKKPKRETEEEIRSLHRTGGNATMIAERQDCSLYWLRKLMGYKDREYTELR
eukprot:m.135808 g.135808  ORF g.135808 m.135808 type:complete len:208 (+) comp13914_c0_seq2:65-688(+)